MCGAGQNLVGEENKGWTYAKYLLTYERTNIAGVGFSVAALNASRHRRQGAAQWPPLAETRSSPPAWPGRDRPGEHEDHQPARDRGRGRWRRARCRKLHAEDPRHRDPPGNHLADRRAMGPYARPISTRRSTKAMPGARGPRGRHAAAHYFNNRKLSIFGGSNEIQKNIISKMILGL
jgi:alkylation response protein AidB-like acyl-CoA dehydrogenase